MKCSKVLRFALMLALGGTVAACGMLSKRDQVAPIGSDDAQLQACLEWFNRLDRAGQTDAQAARIAGFPYLRVSRLMASYRHDVALPTQKAAWLYRMRDLDQVARTAELANLGASAANRFLAHSPEQPLGKILERTQSCGERLVAHDLGDDVRLAQIRERAVVPDAYSGVQRAVGLYPLIRPLLARAERRLAREMRQRLTANNESGSNSTTGSNRTTYWPQTVRRGQRLASRLVTSRRRDALGLPILTSEVREWLLHEFAPVIVLSGQAGQSAAGKITLSQDQAGKPQASVDTQGLTVYSRLAMTRYGGAGLIQLIYTVWLAEPDTQGELDGLMYRVTLDNKGTPVLFDTARTSGMDHHFVPTTLVRAQIDAPDGFRLPPLPDGHRVRIQIDEPMHKLSGIDYVLQSRGNQQFALRPARILQSLPIRGQKNGQRRSLFNRDGLLAGARGRSNLSYWSSGIRRIGTPRQWGHHAISLTDKRHFDDSNIVARRFRLSAD